MLYGINEPVSSGDQIGKGKMLARPLKNSEKTYNLVLS